MMSLLMGLVMSRAALKHIATIPHKKRTQVINKAKALTLDPHPAGSKKLRGFSTQQGEAIYRQRSGSYRILYIVRRNQNEVIILDIENRKDVYRARKKGGKPEDYRMEATAFDEMMRRAIGAPPVPTKPKKRSAKKKSKR